MTNKIYINGPVNVIRLEGQVNNIKKVIYIFMDFHESPQYQTECLNIRSKDIKEYFVENFDKIGETNKVYDFLVEYFPTSMSKYPYKHIYITQIRKLFKSGMNIKDDVVKMSKKFPNIRFHYLDIRDYTRVFIKAMDQLRNYITDIWHNGFRENDTSLIKDSTNIITSHGKYLYDIFYDSKSKIQRSTSQNAKPQSQSDKVRASLIPQSQSDKVRASLIPQSQSDKVRASLIPLDPKPIIPRTAEALSKYTDKDTDKIVRRIINKIKNIYNHQTVKKEINKYLNNELKYTFHKFFDAANKLNKFMVDNNKIIKHPFNKIYNAKDKGAMYGYSLKLRKNLANKLFQLEYDYDDYWNIFQLKIMDVYFLRRFLDKDYITNAITYTGGEHSMNYIRVLVKYFGFNITHFSYMKYDIKKTTDLIKKSKKYSEIQILFFPEILAQCSDLSTFPKLFN